MRPPTHWGDWASSLRLQMRFDSTPDGGLTAGISLRGLRSVVSAADHADAISTLLRAVHALTRGDVEARADWSEPPSEFRWLLRTAGTTALVRVVHLDAERAGGPDDLGHTVWEGAVPLGDLVAACVRATRDLLADAGAASGAPDGVGWTYAVGRDVLEELEAWAERSEPAASALPR